MTQKELLAKCTNRDQKFLDYFYPKAWDIKGFTEQIEFEKVPYTCFIDYHAIIKPGFNGLVIHQFTIEARYDTDAENFFKYLKNQIIDEEISDYHITNIYNTDIYIITINIQ